MSDEMLMSLVVWTGAGMMVALLGLNLWLDRRMKRTNAATRALLADVAALNEEVDRKLNALQAIRDGRGFDGEHQVQYRAYLERLAKGEPLDG